MATGLPHDRSPLGKGDLYNTPGLRLPGYVREVAHAIMRGGKKTKSEAIRIAIGRIEDWAAGKGNVDEKTREKAREAVALLVKARAVARATPNKGSKA